MKDSNFSHRGRAIFLGTGTSDGVPLINCNCRVCRSGDKKDKRLRSSLLLCVNKKNILIDCSMDLRRQLLSVSSKFKTHNAISIDALLITHTHFDHFFGLAEIRPLTKNGALPIYANHQSIDSIKKKFDYFFDEKIQKGGGVPSVFLHEISNEAFKIADIEITPLPISHGQLSILGYKIGNLAYITDASAISESTIEKVSGVDILIINGLRDNPHPTHFSIAEAVAVAKKIGAKKSYFTHIAHNHSDKEYNRLLLKYGDNAMHTAYDGLEFSFFA